MASRRVEDIVDLYGDYAASFRFYESSVTLTIQEIYESFKQRLRDEASLDPDRHEWKGEDR